MIVRDRLDALAVAYGVGQIGWGDLAVRDRIALHQRVLDRAIAAIPQPPPACGEPRLSTEMTRSLFATRTWWQHCVRFCEPCQAFHVDRREAA